MQLTAACDSASICTQHDTAMLYKSSLFPESSILISLYYSFETNVGSFLWFSQFQLLFDNKFQ